MQKHVVTIAVDREDISYQLLLNYKRIKSIIFRVVEDTPNTFMVSLPFGTRISHIENVFRRNHPELTKLQTRVKVIPFTDKTYVFGELVELSTLQKQYKWLTPVTTLDMFYKRMKKHLLMVLEAEVHAYSVLMDVPLIYKTRVRKMKTRWGTNSKQTMTLTFNEKLIHFHPTIIKALVVHELAHYYINGHGANFYKFVERYYPQYKYYDKMLKEHIYDGNY